ncbi:hypothetical protein DEM91_10980 [Prevotella sp. TCVGH]|nr:hypothetical protein [Prevotella sp. TCVGH]
MFGTLMIAKAKLDSLFRRAKGCGVLASEYITFLCYDTTRKPPFHSKTERNRQNKCADCTMDNCAVCNLSQGFALSERNKWIFGRCRRI